MGKLFFLLYNFAVLILLELTLTVLARYGFVSIVYYPTRSSNERFLADIHPSFGVWRYPNRTTTHRSPCFEVQYRSNSYGARDIERERVSGDAERVVVLGDSFVEGYGVEEAERMTTLAEQASKIEFLNFGVSGNFGSIQQWLLYQDLASQFEHDRVAIFFLPDNDFSDNRQEDFSPERYRPYLKKNSDDNYEVYYPVPFELRDDAQQMSDRQRFRRELYNRIYILNIVRQFGDLLQSSKIKDSFDDIADQFEGSSYLDYRQSDLDRLLYTYREIVNLAAPRPVTIFVIPREEDLEFALRNSGFRFELIDQLRKFAAEYPQVEIVDLLPLKLEFLKEHNMDVEPLYHLCDGHWSPLGNRVAAEILLEHIS